MGTQAQAWAGELTSRQPKRSNTRGNDEHHGGEHGQAAPRAAMIARDVVTDVLEAESVSVRLLIARGGLGCDRAQVTAVAETAVGKVVAMERNLP